MATAVRSSKCSSATKPGDPSPIDLNAAGTNGRGVGFTSSVERADVFAGVSAVVDLLPPSLQPWYGDGSKIGAITITDGGHGYTAGLEGTISQVVDGTTVATATFRVRAVENQTQPTVTGVVTAVDITAVGSGYTIGGAVTLAFTSTPSGAGAVTGIAQSLLHNKAITLQVFLSPVDPTDSVTFPNETNTAKGGGLVPTAAQLSTHFHKQFDVPVTLTYRDSDDRRQSIAVCVVSQTYLCVQASVQPTSSARYGPSSAPLVPLDPYQILARVESYLFPTSIPLLDSDNGNISSAAATEATLSAVRDSIRIVSGCVEDPNAANSELKVTVTNAAADAHSVSLVNGGATVSDSNRLPVAAARDVGGTERAILVDSNGRPQCDIITGIGQAMQDGSSTFTSTMPLTDAFGRLHMAPQTFTVRPTNIPNPYNAGYPSQPNPEFDLSVRPDATNHPNYRLVARRARFCLTWSPTSNAANDATTEFLLSMSDGTLVSGTSDIKYEGLVRYTIDPVRDVFTGAGVNYYSVNIDLGLVPRYLSIQRLDGVMKDAECAIFCEV